MFQGEIVALDDVGLVIEGDGGGGVGGGELLVAGLFDREELVLVEVAGEFDC